MPYLGMRPDGEQVTPLEVNEQDTVLCPLCEGELGIRVDKEGYWTGAVCTHNLSASTSPWGETFCDTSVLCIKAE